MRIQIRFPSGSLATLATWVPPLLVAAGYVQTVDFFPEGRRTDYGVLCLLAAGGLLFFRAALRGPLQTTLHLWVVFTTLLGGYFLQFVWLLSNERMLAITAPMVSQGMRPDDLLEAYAQATACLWISGLAAWVRRFRKSRAVDAPPQITSFGRRRIMTQGLVIAALLYLGTSLLMWRYSFGQIGVVQSLPFRLAGWVMALRRTSLPGLLLLVIMAADKYRRFRAAALALLFLSALTDSFLTTTRAALVFVTLWLLALYCVQGTLTKQRIRYILVGIVTASLLFPLLSRVREHRVGQEVDLVSSVEVASRQVSEEDADRNDSIPLIGPLVHRFTGMNALLPIVHQHAHVSPEVVWNGFRGGDGVTSFNTKEVWDLPLSDTTTSVAPSTLGWLYLAGGQTGEILGMFVLTVLIAGLWAFVARLRLKCRPVAQALLIVILLTSLSEGTLDGLDLPFLVWSGTVAALEIWSRVLDAGIRTHAPSLHGSTHVGVS